MGSIEIKLFKYYNCFSLISKTFFDFSLNDRILKFSS